MTMDDGVLVGDEVGITLEVELIKKSSNSGQRTTPDLIPPIECGEVACKFV
jgi:hypothetical protein